MSHKSSGFRKNLLTKTGRQLDFRFDVVHSTGSKKFLVSVFDEGKRITFFHMHKKGEAWKIINAPKVGDDFFQLEEVLSAIIKGLE